MQLLADHGTIDLFSGGEFADPALTTDWLFGPARGKMFGVLECLDREGTTVFLHAFSGQYNGRWLVDGWVPPLFAVDDFLALNCTMEPRIKALGRKIDGCQEHDAAWSALRRQRRDLSRRLTQELHDLYRLTNFRGESTSLRAAYLGAAGIPTGTGDCCAPKLLNHAATRQLHPVGLSEFYWGRENPSATRQHGACSAACREKCQPLLGFMLCGLDG